MANDSQQAQKRNGNGNPDRQAEGQSAQPYRSMHPAAYSLWIGLFAGIIWGLVRWFAVGLKFTDVPQAFLADPWIRRAELGSGFWHFIGLLLFILMSVAAGFVYWALLGKLKGPLPGLFFGAAWWALIFLVVGPPSGAVLPAWSIGWKSLITELCLYVMWGLFIGYSIAFEYHDDYAREPDRSGQNGSGTKSAVS